MRNRKGSPHGGFSRKARARKASTAAGGDPLAGSDPAKIEHRDVQAMTRIVLRPIGSPLPLGFFTMAIDNVLVSVLQWGLLPVVDRRAVALTVFPAFIVQAIAGVLRGNPVLCRLLPQSSLVDGTE